MILAAFLESPLADAEPSWEYFPDGRIEQKVSPSSAHGFIAAWLSHKFLAHLETSGSGLRVGVEVRAILKTASPVPDVSAYRRPAILDAAGELAKYPPGVPCLTIEILSPGQSRVQLLDKCRLFVHGGTELALLLDPQRQAVIAVTASSEQTVRGKDLVPFSAIPEFATLQISVRDVFTQITA